MDTERPNQTPWTPKANQVKRKNSVKCTLKTKVVPKGSSSAARKLRRQSSSDQELNMEPQNELTAILNKRKARTEPSVYPAAGQPTADSERVSPVKAFKSKFESSQKGSDLSSSRTTKGLVPAKPPNMNNNTVNTKSKVSNMASQFTNQINTNSDTTDCKQAFARQTSDVPLKTTKSKPISKIRSSPNITSVQEDKIPTATSGGTGSSHNVKQLRENLFLTIDHNKRLSSSGSSPGSASPVMRSRSPTPGMVEKTPPPLRKKNPALLPKPGQVLTPTGHLKSEPSSKRLSSSSDKSEDPIGEKFVAALRKAGHRPTDASDPSKFESTTLPLPPKPAKVENSTLPLPSKPAKPYLAKKPQLAKSGTSSPAAPGSPALPPKLIKPMDTAASGKVYDNNGTSSAALPARTKKVQPLPKLPPESSSNAKTEPSPSSPPKKSPVGGMRIADELSRPIPPIKPTVAAQLSTGSDYYEDVEVMDYSTQEGDKDSGRGSAEGAIDVDKRSSGTGSFLITSVFSNFSTN